MNAAARELVAMHRALELGQAAVGNTSPNPPVGAVILAADGAEVGAGYTQPAGQAHAEIMALRAAGSRAQGGTAVVTLEPCNHTGRTGPCVDALLAAGIERVVYARPEPTALAGHGAERLRAGGVDVLGGLLADEAAAGALRWWLRSVQRSRPAVIWKFASTLDGRVAAADGSSRWITSAPARADVHRLRARVDAIMVGSGTVRADDPALTARDERGDPLPRQPLRVVLDRTGRVRATARVFDDQAPTIRVDAPTPAEALHILWDTGIRAVLLEGGPTVAGAFLAAGCIDEVVAYLAPTLLGAGPLSLGPAGIGTLADAVHLILDSVHRVGADVKIVARLE